ncbi:arginine repressor [Plebeiibacterium marinum]|uniref:Arginine repressor n=1 Tax=Plebeiibacterium marinum TaxID=2992111 RepID=A0AAE3MBE5_9BACT|nr:arginine repressor [Plebeiobacterium marinum]MCW3804346.1 arginine repressor [Plebeiobacterium marinum]
MKVKAQRLATIKNIINSQNVSSQEELLSLLEKEGFMTTQATLSRDLKFLKVAKIPHSDLGYVYEMPQSAAKAPEEIHEDFPVSGIESIDFSGNLAVIKTRPGFANSIASVIDSHDPYEILGTIAGDDTILLINREGVSKNHIVEVLSIYIPGLKEKIL